MYTRYSSVVVFITSSCSCSSSPPPHVAAAARWFPPTRLPCDAPGVGIVAFVHVVDAAGVRLFSADHPPTGLLPSYRWVPGKIYVDSTTFVVPEGLARGALELRLGLFEESWRARVAPKGKSDGTDRVKGPQVFVSPG